MWIMKNTSTELGQAKYGSNFFSYDYCKPPPSLLSLSECLSQSS